MDTYDGPSFDEGTQFEDDKRLYVQFFVEAVKNETKSVEAGRAIFDERPMIRIMTPGSRDVMVTKASEQYQQRFPRQWDLFQRKQEQVTNGTPLEQVPFLTVGQIAELKAVNCSTLEQLATMSDQLAGKFMGMHGLRRKAQAFLDVATEAIPFTKMQAELEKRDVEISMLKAQIAQLVAAMPKKDAVTA